MNPKDNTEIMVDTLLTLRQESDAVRVITERLKVKEMGPTDHIRTKHEVKAFVESGDTTTAEELINRAKERIADQQSITNRISERQERGQQIGE